jgi:Transposase DDE domain
MATTLADENWQFLLKLLPADWEQLARNTGAVTRVRGFDSVDQLLRGLLLHVGLGCSLRETVILAKAAGWLNMSDVALLKKLRQSERWLQALCVGLLHDSELALPDSPGMKMRLIEGTHVKEPGQTGSQWRVHFSLRVPEWTCDFFRLTGSEGEGNGESLRQFPVRSKDCLIADRGYAQAAGIGYVQQKGGYVIVRHNAQNLPVEMADGSMLDLLPWLRGLARPGQVDSRTAYVRIEKGPQVAVHLCAVRKSDEAIVASQRKLRRRAQRKGQHLRAQTLEYSQWVIVLTTVPREVLNDARILQWYRLRWQIELAFKRLKSLAGLGHLPKYDAVSSRAWLYGKLLVALLTEKMQRYAQSFSPWGGRWCEQETPTEPLA